MCRGCGQQICRWDYIFSFIKKFAEDPNCVMPDRAKVTMTSHFLRNYSLLLIKTCHRRTAAATTTRPTSSASWSKRRVSLNSSLCRPTT